MNNNSTAISLVEFQNIIKEGLSSLFPGSYNIIAEINEIKTNASGHCYLVLVEHDKDSSVPKAKISANIWAYTFRMLKPYFESETGRQLEAGIKVLLSVQVQYHEVYGLSLNVTDIDPAYTVGEIEIQRQKTIQKLIDDGIFDMNKSIEMPILPLRLAIISSKTAAGYQDFLQQLYGSGYNYNFTTQLFEALMQGKEAEESIKCAIDRVYNSIDNFDVLVIIRGGGSVSDLACFDSYALAFNLAQIPIPIITGIGHDKDVSVVDLIAHTMTKTPTAAAEFLIDTISQQNYYLNNLSERFTDLIQEQLQEKNLFLQNTAMQLKGALSTKLASQQYFLDNFIGQRLKPLINSRFREIHTKLELYNKIISLRNPQAIMQQGYSVITFEGKTIKDAKDLGKGDDIKISFAKGNKKATIQ